MLHVTCPQHEQGSVPPHCLLSLVCRYIVTAQTLCGLCITQAFHRWTRRRIVDDTPCPAGSSRARHQRGTGFRCPFGVKVFSRATGLERHAMRKCALIVDSDSSMDLRQSRNLLRDGTLAASDRSARHRRRLRRGATSAFKGGPAEIIRAAHCNERGHEVA